MPNTLFFIQLFNNPKDRDKCSNAEGKTLIDAFGVTTDSDGCRSFERTVKGCFDCVTATATRLNTGDTSEFSDGVNSKSKH